MHEQSEADRYLMQEIRRGSPEAWSQLLDRYQGRLIAFARRRAPTGSDPEDLVQDTFLQFLRGLTQFREEASLETFLFLILRRRLAELHRGRAAKPVADAVEEVAAPDPTASWYVRRDEQRDAAHQALANALHWLIQRMQANTDFRDLQIIELLFYAQWPNQKIALELGEDANHIALLKHRWLKELRQRLSPQSEHSPEILDSLLTEIWEEQRPSCPKRSTIGGFVLGTLDEAWQNYVEFHLHRLECAFCRANLEDMQAQSRQDPEPLRQRIMQSTVGFFRKS